ncbi:hypothetical protein [Streptomyces crystallinus]|uniref:Uncharacterized protein n=1 Tax=Streptomyces crystallinus TaxID=68191 RepID=A0ABN1GHV5_9ACTN
MDAEVALTAVTPELEALRAAREAYLAALAGAVVSLARDEVPLSDISAVPQVPPAQVRQILADRVPTR